MSGLLYESNLVMYDRATESLWSQSLGESIAGTYAGTELDIIVAQYLSVGELRETHPDVLILSEDTGYERDYRRNPYAGYEQSEELIAPVGRTDERFPTKTIMFVVPLSDSVLAVPYDSIPEGRSRTESPDGEVVISKDGPTKTVTIDGEQAPGYLEMWFSVIAQHDAVEVWEP